MTIAGCGGGGHTTTTHGTTPRGSTTDAAEQTAAARFAGAYVRFLDGAGTAAGLPDATASVRSLAGRAGPVPASRRRGTLVLSQLRPAQARSDSYLLAARDNVHTFYADITLQQQRGR